MSRGPLRWGVLGTAGIAESFVRGVRMGDAGTIHAVASRDLSRARAWAERFAVPLAFGSYDELLGSGAVDLVYNPLPNSLHAEWTVRALEAGLPVLCEKPLTVNAAEAREVAAASARTGLAVAEAFMYRFHPVYDRVLETIASGAIGELVSISAQFTFFLDDRAQIAASAKLGGGSLRDVGCYAVNLARRIAGREPVRAMAMTRGTEVDDTLVGLLEFPGGILAQVECGIESHERHRAEIAGTAGSILLARPWFPGLDEGRFLLCRGEREEEVVSPGGDGYHLEAMDFVRAVQTRTPPRWPVADAVANMAAIDALLRSAREGVAVAVNG